MEQATRPFDTARLKPLRQQTKHGIFQLLSSGDVWIDFMIDPTLTVIAPDGQSVKCFSKGTTPDQLVSSPPLEQYDYRHLPSPKQKIYEYARRFVALLRSKTPRIVLSTSRFRAFLMDNGPPSDFCLRYYAGKENGWRLEYSAASRCLRIYDPSGQCQSTVINPDSESLAMNGLTPSTRLMLGEFLGRHGQATATCSRIREDQDSGHLPFPFVVREQSSPDHAAAESLVPAPTIPMLTLGAGTGLETSLPIRPFGYCSETLPTAPFLIAYRTFLPQIGWCLASADDQYLLLFSDGASILLNGRKNIVGYQDSSRPLCWFQIDETLPKFAKSRLAYFPRFVHQLRQANT